MKDARADPLYLRPEWPGPGHAAAKGSRRAGRCGALFQVLARAASRRLLVCLICGNRLSCSQPLINTASSSPSGSEFREPASLPRRLSSLPQPWSSPPPPPSTVARLRAIPSYGAPMGPAVRQRLTCRQQRLTCRRHHQLGKQSSTIWLLALAAMLPMAQAAYGNPGMHWRLELCGC